MVYDKIIIGAGLYGLYAAELCGGRGEKVLVLEYDQGPFMRATYINQARVHMGYHYPRSYSTAVKSASYFARFNRDYAFCIYDAFDQIYAISASFSWTSASQFQKFCSAARIRCDRVSADRYFNDGMCDGAFATTEYTYDAQLLKAHFVRAIAAQENVVIQYGARINGLEQKNSHFVVKTADGKSYATDFLLNATYASTNQIIYYLGYEPFKIKYELCELILCSVGERLKNVGITVMDGPFFSIMPFGKTGYHSLTSVTFTPHVTSFHTTPEFPCQALAGTYCTPRQLGNCNDCLARPRSAWAYMSGMARKYLKADYDFSYEGSLFSMKPVLQVSEVDDSRPTVIKQFSAAPTFISVLSGKINTVYDLDEVLEHC